MPNPTERLELARRLHDGLAQELAALGYALDGLIADPRLVDELRGELRAIRLRLIDLNSDFRDEIYLLRRLSFTALAHQLRQLLTTASVRIELPEVSLDPAIEDALAKALLEIGRNSAKHSGCARFAITNKLTEGRLEIFASDDGDGAVSTRQRAFGLASIYEHLAGIGASVECVSGQAGTHYTIRYSIVVDDPS